MKTKYLNLLGKKFGRLKIVGFNGSITVGANREKWAAVLCKCDCGKLKTLPVRSVVTGNTKSCGCLYRDSHFPGMILKHGHSSNALGRSSEYHSWQDMKSRCLNKNNKFYSNYGGRGISICKEWIHSFSAFIKDMGKKPDGTTLDRKNVNEDYTKKNCRWATRTQQDNNRTNTVWVEYKGSKMSLMQLSVASGIPYNCLRYRIIRRGWPIDIAATIKPGKAGRRQFA